MKRKQVYYNEHDVNQVKEILRNKKKNKLKKKFKIMMILLLLGVIGYYFMSDLSKVNEVKIMGNYYLSTSEIESVITVTNEDYLLFVDKGEIVEKIKALPIVKDVKIKMNLTRDIVIEITESSIVTFGYVDDQIMIVDEKGRVKSLDDDSFLDELKVLPQFFEFDQDMFEAMAKEFVQFPGTVSSLISDVVYQPTGVDTKRVKFIFDNGKILYARIDDIVSQLERIDILTTMEFYDNNSIFSLEGGNLYITGQ